MPSSKKPAVSASKPAAKKPLKAKAGATASKPVAATKVKTVPVKSTKSTPSADLKKPATTAVATATATPAVKKVGRPPKAAAASGAAAPATGAKRGRKPKAGNEAPTSDVDMSDIEDDLAGEPVVASTEEKVKPLRMKISKAKERALMKEFGLDETVLSEEDMAKRRSR
ncbi:MAG: RNA polymerase sigma factor RpoD, partial [Comamonadaceae bacterium]